MKKLAICIVALVAFSFSSVAQEVADNAIGLRIGENDGIGAEINYQRGISDNNRLEFGLGWRSSDNVDIIKLTGLYQWVFRLDGNLNWYVGAGGGLAQVSIDDSIVDVDDETFLFVAGDIGIEYDFDIPILISLDFRPELGLGDYGDDLDFDVALGIRYQF